MDMKNQSTQQLDELLYDSDGKPTTAAAAEAAKKVEESKDAATATSATATTPATTTTSATKGDSTSKTTDLGYDKYLLDFDDLMSGKPELPTIEPYSGPTVKTLPELSDYLEERMTKNKPQTKEEKAKEDRLMATRQGIAAIGDMVRAIANLGGTVGYAPNGYSPSQSMSAKVKARWDELKKERQAQDEDWLEAALKKQEFSNAEATAARAAYDADVKAKNKRYGQEYDAWKDKVDTGIKVNAHNLDVHDKGAKATETSRHNKETEKTGRIAALKRGSSRGGKGGGGGGESAKKLYFGPQGQYIFEQEKWNNTNSKKPLQRAFEKLCKSLNGKYTGWFKERVKDYNAGVDIRDVLEEVLQSPFYGDTLIGFIDEEMDKLYKGEN